MKVASVQPSERRSEKLRSVLSALIGEGGSGAALGEAHGRSERQVPAGDLLYRPGGPSDHLYVVLEGRLRVFAVSEGGREVVFWQSQPGDLLGVAETLCGHARLSFAQARVDTRVLVLHAEAVRRRMLSHPQAAQVLLEHLGERLCRARGSILAIATASVASRLAHLLLVLSEDTVPLADGRRVLATPYSQQELADMVGASRQSVSEGLAMLRRRGFLEPDGTRLVLSSGVGRLPLTSSPT